MSIHVVASGLLSTVQDLGRTGYQHLGVPVGGVMDAFALRVANLLVGNEEGDAGLEITITGPTLRFEADALIVLAGSDPGARLEPGGALPPWRCAHAARGAKLSFAGAPSGCRAYLAVAGGIAVPPVLGSRSTLVRAALGGVAGRALREGDMLPLGAASPLAARITRTLPPAAVARWGAGPTARPAYVPRAVVRLLPGAHQDALDAASRTRLHAAEFVVSPQSDRAGYRLDGPRLALRAPLELLSEPVVFGTVQLPPDGRPIILMADRQPTGGYPRIGEVASADLPLLAQLRPGDTVRFRPATLAQAHAARREAERTIAQLRAAISLHHP